MPRANWSVRVLSEEQIRQVLENLKRLLAATGSGLERLAKVNIYADSAETINKFQEQLWSRLDAEIRPAVCAVISPLSTADALVAVDAVAIADDHGEDVALQQCEGVASQRDCADASVVPRGGVAYLSGHADKSPLPQATVNSMTALLDVVRQLNLHPSQIVQLKVFIDSAAESRNGAFRIKAVVSRPAGAAGDFRRVDRLGAGGDRDGRALAQRQLA